MLHDSRYNRAQAVKARVDALAAKAPEDRARLFRIAGHYDAMADIQLLEPMLG